MKNCFDCFEISKGINNQIFKQDNIDCKKLNLNHATSTQSNKKKHKVNNYNTKSPDTVARGQ